MDLDSIWDGIGPFGQFMAAVFTVFVALLAVGPSQVNNDD